MKVRKLLISGALSMLLALSVFVMPAFAVSFSDTEGLNSDVSISKLVSLGVMKNPGEEFNPDGNLSGADFSYMAKQVGLNVSHGGKSVKYSELAKALANGLGLKASWTNRPIDYLYYLDRKGVLDIDTDLDAAVTRAEAAEAFDRYITLKGTFTSFSGVVSGTSDKGVAILHGGGVEAYYFAPGVSSFVSGVNSDISNIQPGIPVDVVLNKAGQVAYIAGVFLDAEEGALKFDLGKLNIAAGKFMKDLNLDALVVNPPNVTGQTFNMNLFKNWQDKGIAFAGQAFFTSDDVVSLIYPYVQTVKGTFGYTADGIMVVVDSGLSLPFGLAEDATVKIDGEESDLAALKAYRTAGTAYTAVFTADSGANVTAIEVTTKK